MRTAGMRAFTLVELLVVIGIVAIVAATLFPVFASVRERGRRTVCQSNLRQIALAMQQYVADSDGQYPLVSYLVKKGGVNVGVISWQHVIFPYLKDARVLYCPDYPADAPDWAGITSLPPLQFENYNYDYDALRLNTYRLPTSIPVRGRHEADLVNPATIWLNVDRRFMGDSSGADDYQYARDVMTSCGRFFVGSTLHTGGGNYSFLDGHVRWLTPEAMGEVECSNGPPPFPFND